MKNLKNHFSDCICPKSKPQHTPTPWFLEAGTGSKEGWRVEGERMDGMRFTIADTHLPGPLTHANAAFIVRAVNAHAELVNQAKCLETAARRFADGSDNSPSYVLSLCKLMREALAAAEKGDRL